MSETTTSTVPPPEGPVGPKRGTLSKLYHGETSYRIVERQRIWFVVSGLIILAGLIALPVRGGLNFGIDFTGGALWEFPSNGVSVTEAEDAMSDIGFSEIEVQEVGESLRVSTPALEGTEAERRERNDEVIDTLATLSDNEAADVAVRNVGASWGEEISRKALQALVVFLIAIVIYITIRFEFRMAIATLGALIHDILVVIGTYAILQLPVTPETVVAFLTILGFSIYDGIVVFDRVDENTRLLTSNAKITYTQMVDRSLNDVLMRSLNTQITAIIPILSVLLVGSLALGADSLQEFGLALFIGQLSGAYSSIFIAAPLLALLKEREPRYKNLRAKLEGKAAAATAEAAVEVSDDEPADVPAPKTTLAKGATPKGTPPPRPRKKGKKR